MLILLKKFFRPKQRTNNTKNINNHNLTYGFGYKENQTIALLAYGFGYKESQTIALLAYCGFTV
ncbi:MAG: hypothetical protein A3J51_00475 [Omnitrophica WOR_2 bacterium RIFCSPHIGHO2_02_FULL_45_21]|nr:MAG: hypothetical protein A3J51_00475 [Omnitrophica WOR_2 bacterium RIFCSPHIGHO2_02_FULL_45_21]